ncbi:MAG TPA: DcaP family trimeric outer membrane transporter [Telmatospirillum sp.]|nr:DcaP family trimeric outer membrane transporter [Telmatospirillum sp.]
MRSLHKYGTMVAVAALFAASGTVAQAADADLQSLQQQINMLQQQLKDVQAKQAAAPAAGPLAGAATVPANGGPGFLQYGSSAGGFVIPGTKTALKIGGNMKFDMAWDVDAGIGGAGVDQYQIRNAGLAGSGGFALPGTPAARQLGRFSANAGYSRLNFETRTPSEYGEIKFYTEVDFSGSNGGNEYNSNSHAVRLRHAYGTVGNWLIGQTWTNWTDRATVPNSVENNGPIGPESGVRQALISYRWDIDPAQKNQMYFSVENPFSDFAGADNEALSGAGINNATNFNHKYPDVLAKFAHNESWGRTYLTAMVRDLSIDTVGIPLGSAAGSKFTGATHDSTVAWGLTGGGKIYTGFGNPKNAVYVRVEGGQGIGRYMNFNSINQNASAVVDTNGKLQSTLAGSYEVSYQHFWNDTNTWQSNVIWGDQKIWQKSSLLTNSLVNTSTSSGIQGLPTDFQEIELNLMWSPNSFVMMGPAYIRANARTVAGQNLIGVAGATRATSGTTAIDNRFQFTTQIGF